ncbi:MAG TPA: hypothetical protein VKY45_09335 [Marinilabiliaceae bacterium]|nr:hypothetical protein [Marinilabiliaceae bacterium]
MIYLRAVWHLSFAIYTTRRHSPKEKIVLLTLLLSKDEYPKGEVVPFQGGVPEGVGGSFPSSPELQGVSFNSLPSYGANSAG